MRDHDFSQAILDWYDKNARMMPWRVGPADRVSGIRPDPYRVWLSEIMLQQTTVATVGDYFHRFILRWPTVQALANAQDEDVMGEWAGLGYYARARNLLKCARFVASDLDGKFPASPEALMKLPGIGPYTAGAVASIAFDYPAVVVDGNVERVMSRMFLVETPLPAAKKPLTELAARLTPKLRPGDYAQAVMDLGATICTPKSPACSECPWNASCGAYARGVQAEFPKKLPKRAKPTRYGIAYIARRSDGALLLERRPDSGLLGGMLGWPGSQWGDDPADVPPMDAEWRLLNEEVRHTFTHFHLRLSLQTAEVPIKTTPLVGNFVKYSDFQRSDLPTVMRKAFDLASQHLTEN